MIYEENQVECIFPFITSEVLWFVVAGPADGNGAQRFHRQYPDIQILGFEPNREFFKCQLDAGFPGLLRPEVLWDKVGTADFHVNENNARGSRLVFDTQKNRISYKAHTTTLDSVFYPNRPRSVVLWMDIERSELIVLRGAEKILSKGIVNVVLVESFQDERAPLMEYLSQYKYEVVSECHKQKLESGIVSDLIFRIKR